MRLRNIIVIIVVVLFAISCSKGEGREPSKQIIIDARIGSLSTAKANSSSFLPGDKVSVYSWVGNNTFVQLPLIVDNTVNTFDGKIWSTITPMLWKDMVIPHYFIGIYPPKAVTDFAADNYTTVGDVLVANVLGEGKSASNGGVALVFDHIMSKLIVNLEFRTQWEGIPSVNSVEVSILPNATVNYITKSAVATGKLEELLLTPIKANTSYTQIIAPQIVKTITITIGDKIFTYNSEAGIEFVSGKSRTINLTVGSDAVTLTSMLVDDWGASEIIDGGELEQN